MEGARCFKISAGFFELNPFPYYGNYVCFCFYFFYLIVRHSVLIIPSVPEEKMKILVFLGSQRTRPNKPWPSRL